MFDVSSKVLIAIYHVMRCDDSVEWLPPSDECFESEGLGIFYFHPAASLCLNLPLTQIIPFSSMKRASWAVVG